MKNSNKIITSIAVVSLGISGILAGEGFDYLDPSVTHAPDYVDDLLNPSEMVGKWYVLGATGFKDPRPQPRCWTIDLQEQFGSLQGVSNFIEVSTDSWITTKFNANFAFERSDSNVFIIDGMFNEESLKLDVACYPIRSHDHIAIDVHDFRDSNYSGLRMLMSRQSTLDGVNIGKPEYRIDNTDCPSGRDLM